MVFVFLPEKQTPIRLFWTSTPLGVGPISLAMREIDASETVEFTTSMLELNGFTTVGLAIMFDIDVRGGNVGIAVKTGVVTSEPLVRELPIVGPGNNGSRVWPLVVTGPVRIDRVESVGRLEVTTVAAGRTTSSTLAQS